MINTLRHSEVFNAHEHNERIVIVGAGAIGSRVFENLVSTGLTNITLVDFDKVESHNLANQLYVREDIGNLKVLAANRWCVAKCGQDVADSIRFINGKVDEHAIAWFTNAKIVISCVDTFDARRVMSHMASKSWSDMFIDTRMATGHCDMYMVNPDNPSDVKRWTDTLGDDDDPSYETSACGESLSVGVTAQTIGAVTSWSVMNYLKTGFIDKHIRVDTAPWLVSRQV